MTETHLYIVEGLPCSGKSSTAKFIADKTGGLLYDEGCGNHPADWEFHAFVPDNAGEFTPEERLTLAQIAEKHDGGMVIPLNRVSGELFDKALKYKIYDFLDWDKERPLMLHKWRQFAENVQENRVYVFNCVLLQNPMCETMMRFNFAPEISYDFIREICEIIAPLNPVVVYLKNTDIESSIQSPLPERGNDWLNAVVDYHCNGAFGKANGLSGFDGYITALKERQQRELEFLPKLPVKHIILDDPQKDWNSALGFLTEKLTAI